MKKRASPRARPRVPARTARTAGPAAGPAKSPAAGSPAAAPELSERQRRHLRGLAHPLKPVVRLGNAGLTEAVALETERALRDHELIKVKAPGGDRDARDALFASLAGRTASALVHRIGNVAVLYRPHPELPRILIPD
jgi:RNA-binding protein